MPSDAPRLPNRLPTLTEVVAWPATAPMRVEGVTPAPATAGAAVATDLPSPPAAAPTPGSPGLVAAPAMPPPSSPGAPPPPPPPPPAPPVLRSAEDVIIQGVLLQLQRQVELMLEYRLREVLTPLLARAADGVVRDARGELASTLRDVVARAVADELARHRGL